MELRRTNKTIVTFLLSLLTLAASSLASAEIESIAEAINKAGRQRMLTQRIVRMYAQVSLGVKANHAYDELGSAVELYETQLKELVKFSPTDKITARLETVEKLWRPFNRLVTEDVSSEGLEELHETNDELLRASHRVVIELQDYVGTASGKLVNISGRQRMLSQRITKFFMLRKLGFKGAEIRDDMERAMTEFRGGLVTLSESRFNSDEINLALKQVDRIYEDFEQSITSSSDVDMDAVSETSDDILKRMNKITGDYVELAQNL